MSAEGVKTIEWRDLWLVAQVWRVNSAVMGFSLVEITAMEDDGVEGCKLYFGDDHCTDLKDAETYIEGDIKFDECANFTFNPTDHCAVHICGLDGLRKLVTAFERLYAEARSMGIVTT